MANPVNKAIRDNGWIPIVTYSRNAKGWNKPYHQPTRTVIEIARFPVPLEDIENPAWLWVYVYHDKLERFTHRLRNYIRRKQRDTIVKPAGASLHKGTH